MSAVLRAGQRRGRLVALAYFATGALAAAMLVGAPHLPLSGSPMGLVMVVVLALAPVGAALAIERPLVVPFALWAALVPFDNLLTVAGIGKIAKPLGAAAALAALIAMLLRRRALLPPFSAGVWSLLALYATVSLFWARSPDFGITMLQQIAGLLVVGAVLSMFPADERDLRALFCGVVGGGAAAGVYAITMYALTGHALFIGDTTSRPIDHNHFGAALLLPALCATMATVSARRPLRATLCGLGAVLCVAGIGVSQSRGALIAFGIALAYLIVRSRHRYKLLSAVVAGSALLAAIPGTLGRFSDSTVSDGAGRYQIWHIGWSAFQHRWFAGHGFGMFMPAYQASFLEYSQPAEGAQRVQMPHNILIEFSVELGVIGVVFLLLAWWWQLRTLREVGPDEGGWTDAARALEATTIALFVSALSLDLLTFKYTWLALSAAWILRAAYRSRAPARPETSDA